MTSKMAKLTIPTPHNCLECDVLKEWYSTKINTIFVKCHAGECTMFGCPGEYKTSNIRPDYCPLDVTDNK